MCTKYLFEKDGYVGGLPAISSQEAAALKQEILHSANDEDFFDRHMKNGAHKHLRSIFQLVTDSRVIRHVAKIFDGPILMLNSGILLKHPGDQRFTGWHQDSAYSLFDSSDILTAWIAITESNKRSGCLQMIPGSHLKGRQPHINRPHPLNMLSKGQSIVINEQSHHVDYISLNPGELSLHAVDTIHSSGKNTSAHSRIGVGAIYLPGYAIPKTAGMEAIEVRGTYSGNKFSILKESDLKFAK